MSLVVELQDPTWHVDETFAALRKAGAVLCTTELPPEGEDGAAAEPEPPFIRKTGSFFYLRLRRHDYSAAELDAWASQRRTSTAMGSPRRRATVATATRS